MPELSVLIPDGENEHTLWVARSLAQSGQVKVSILSSKRWTSVRFSRHCRPYKFRPTGTDRHARLRALTEVTRRIPVNVILPVGEEGVLFASIERKALSKLAALPPLPDPDSLKIARNKWLLNQFAREHHLPAPELALVTLDEAFGQRIPTLQYPCYSNLLPWRTVRGYGALTHQQISARSCGARTQHYQRIGT